MNEQTVSKVPQIRFKGFEDEWEEKTLGELGHVATNKRIFMHQTASTGDVPFFKIGSFGREPTLFISQSLFDTYKARFPFPQKGDLLFSVIGSIGRVVEYTGQDEYFQDSNIVWLQHNGAVVNRFLKQFYSIVKWSGLEGSTIIHLYNRNILETKIVLPCQPEQIQIGEYFRALDSLISLHQRKHGKLVALKKAMLQKMFPQPGATTPEIRFNGFSGEWMEKRLGDIIDLSSGRDYKHLSPGDIPVYGTGGYMLSVNEALSTNRDAVGIGRKGTIDKPYLLKAPFWTVDTLFYAIPKAENYLNFVYCIFQRIDWKQKDESTGVPSLSKVAINGVAVLSTSPAEQQKIGTYFRTLDELISKHATQLQKLQQIKSACLEKMFV